MQSLDSIDSTTKSTSYKYAYNRHRRRPNDLLFIGDLDDMVDFIQGGKLDSRIIHFSDSNQNKKKMCDGEMKVFEYKGPVYGLKSHPVSDKNCLG
mmetsp:Transcript_11049/g.12202  ORF Transcript_11049/g.12202 Transcript_11049/m.12202 type:complete len:95 (+) Transcript_11049:92-376(+)